MRTRVPSSPDAISPEWISAALRSTGRLTSESVTRVEAEVVGEDRGFTGVVARLHLEYASDRSDHLPRTAIVKMPHAERAVPSEYLLRQSTSPDARRSMLRRGLRELAFYDEIVPESHVPVPERLYGASDPDTLESILVLEDLKDAIAGDGLAGCSPRDAELVLRAIASLHATWWRQRSLDERGWLAPAAVDPELRRKRYDAALPAFLTRYATQIPAGFRELIETLGPSIPALINASARPPRTLIHADLHLDNVMFTPGQAGGPVRLIDWQSVTIGPAALDVAMLLSGSLEPEDQAGTANELLHAYHSMLVDGGVSEYGFEDLLRDYRIWLLRLIVGVVIWLGTADMDALAGRERAIVEAAISDGRLIAAAESQDLITAIPAS